MTDSFSHTTRIIIASIALLCVGTIFGIMIELVQTGPLLAVCPLVAWGLVHHIFRLLREHDEVSRAGGSGPSSSKPAA